MSRIFKFQQNLIQASGRSMCSEIHTIINSMRNKEGFPQQLKQVAHYKCDTADCTYCYSIPLLSTAHKIWPTFTCHVEFNM